MANRTPRPREVRALVEAVDAYRSEQPWKAIDDIDPVVLLFPDDDVPWFGSVLGCAGQEFGLYLTRGLDGLAFFRRWSGPPEVAQRMLEENRDAYHLGFTIDRWEDLPLGQQKRLLQANVRRRREASVPCLMMIEKGRSFTINAKGLRRLLLATRAILDVHARGELAPDDRPSPQMLKALEISESPEAPTVSLSWQDHGELPAFSDDDALMEERERAISAIPCPPEVAAWREAEDAVLQLSLAALDRGDISAADAAAKYFGGRDGLDILDEMRSHVLPSFATWVVERWRERPRAPTILESLRKQHLTPKQRQVVEARRRSSPTFFRFDTVDSEQGWVTGTDLLTGDSVRFHDRGLAITCGPGDVFALSLVRVEDVILAEPFSPPMRGGEFDAAVHFLEQEGLDVSVAGLKKQPHLLGRLWSWHLGRLENPVIPQMNNTDGDPYEFVEMLLRADDASRVLAEFEARDDVDYDESDGSYVWFIENDGQGSRAALLDYILIGRIQVIGDEILVSVNSRARADRARAWLERIRGVRFESIDVRPWSALRETPLDDRPTAEERAATFPPEVLEQIAEHMRARYRAWLDESIPALGGKTPREAARTKKGRDRVALLIRTMEAPMEGMDADAFRSDLLRELGMD